MDTEPEMTSFEARCLQDPDDPEAVVLELDQKVCDRMGWHVGDILEWIDNKDGTWTLKKKITD